MSIMDYITVRIINDNGNKNNAPDVTLDNPSVGDDGSLRLREEKSHLCLRGEVFPFKEVLLELSEGSRLLRESPVVSGHI